jgi:hypothetical protein
MSTRPAGHKIDGDELLACVTGKKDYHQRSSGKIETSCIGAFLGPICLPTQVKRAVDQVDMIVSLRKIAQHAPEERIDLFGEQTHVAAAREQTVK